MTTVHDLRRRGLSQREIAERLNLAQSTVHYRLRHANVERGHPDHGHIWRTRWNKGAYRWECDGCGDELPAGADTESFVYDCRAAPASEERVA